MPSCLGLYIEENIIKYAKVTKENDSTKIESFGIKFFDKIEDAIKQIISETFSYKIPISVNIANETYDYFSIVNLLNKKDLKKVINTQFETQCEEKGQNISAFDTRHAIVTDIENKEKIRVINVAISKNEIARKKSLLEGSKIHCMTPMPIAIANLLNKEKEIGNAIIVDIEDKTTITTILNQNIYNVDKIDIGASQILDKINEKENSYAKAYEICKNTTIYTSDASDLQIDENPYLEDIMPTLYTIAEKVNDIMNNSLQKIDKVYITGTMAVINNIDIYFAQYMVNADCELLKPSFVQENPLINIKDYIEVDAPVALALQGLGEGVKAMNFVNLSLLDKLPDWMKIDIGGKNKNKEGKHKESKIKVNNDFNSPITNVEKHLLRSLGGVILILIVYIIFAIILNSQFEDKKQEVTVAERNAENKISSVNSDISNVNQKINEYTLAIKTIEDLNAERANNLSLKNTIPNLMTQIMNAVPIQAQVTSIKNTEARHIVINVQSENYEQLGYFIAKIKNDMILKNVVSNSGVKQGGVVKIAIEGELP